MVRPVSAAAGLYGSCMNASSPHHWEQAGDQIVRRLKSLADDLERDLGNEVRVERQRIFSGGVTLTPTRDDALAVSWIDLGTELQVQTASGFGGRFELSRTERDVDFIEAIVRSVVAGRVVEVFAPRRSRVTITLADGTTEVETGYDGLTGCLPLPMWPRWGRTVRYSPYGPIGRGGA